VARRGLFAALHKALVGAGIVQGFPTPPLMLLIMLMTNTARLPAQPSWLARHRDHLCG
jgi:hypothetical protein